MVQTTGKNLWVASSDGDLERVQYLIEHEGYTPNDKDENSYSPMHAAASYAHLPLLEYLLSKGGNINLPDDDGETPLYVVESVCVAKFLVERGADAKWKNNDGLTAAQQLKEDHPEVAQLLEELTGELTGPGDDNGRIGAGVQERGLSSELQISQFALDNYTTTQSAALMEEAQKIMEQCAQEGVEPDDRLREVLERAIQDGQLVFGQRPESEEVEGSNVVDANKKLREE
ncbi:hypothetical protein L204_100462 [Cryptococcus depauperatus]|nr:ankyrin repeat-containing protein [Cryptococcus depauperatus CBS 7855]